ncbi:BPSL0761 family protein [Piscinibacter sp.]|uniref:BPSL0761 family protein n=1 Tax=Piscinibacter sp. TaxID=1903157 RepID=UPI00391F50EC
MLVWPRDHLSAPKRGGESTTLPSERLRALQWAGELLTEIKRDEALPEGLRHQAHVTLRHYLTGWQLAAASSSPMELRSWIARDDLTGSPTQVAAHRDAKKDSSP